MVVVDDQLVEDEIGPEQLNAAIKKALGERSVTYDALQDVLPSEVAGPRADGRAAIRRVARGADRMVGAGRATTSTTGLSVNLAEPLLLQPPPDRRLLAIRAWFPPDTEYQAISPQTWIDDRTALMAREGPGLVLFDEDLNQGSHRRARRDGRRDATPSTRRRMVCLTKWSSASCRTATSVAG